MNDTTHYELLYIVPGNYNEDELAKIRESVKNILQKYEGAIVFDESLGKRKMAYPIKHVRHGYYIVVEFDAATDAIKKINDELRLTSEVLRHNIITKEMSATSLPKLRELKSEAPVFKPAEQAAPVAAAAVETSAPTETHAPATEEKAAEPAAPVTEAEEKEMEEEKEKKDEEPKAPLEDLDKKLDEILEGDIL